VGFRRKLPRPCDAQPAASPQLQQPRDGSRVRASPMSPSYERRHEHVDEQSQPQVHCPNAALTHLESLVILGTGTSCSGPAGFAFGSCCGPTVVSGTDLLELSRRRSSAPATKLADHLSLVCCTQPESKPIGEMLSTQKILDSSHPPIPPVTLDKCPGRTQRRYPIRGKPERPHCASRCLTLVE